MYWNMYVELYFAMITKFMVDHLMQYSIIYFLDLEIIWATIYFSRWSYKTLTYIFI